MNTQKMNFDFTSTNFASHFIQFLFIITVCYLVYQVSEYLKSRNQEGANAFNFDFILLLRLYQKFSVFGGIGFIVSDFFTHLIRTNTASSSMGSIIDGPLNAFGWNNFAFGIVLIFLGIGLRIFINGVKTNDKPSQAA